MAAYKIIKDSLKEENGYLRCNVVFYDEDNNSSEEQFYEVQGLSRDVLKSSLEKTAKAYAQSKVKLVLEKEDIVVGEKISLE